MRKQLELPGLICSLNNCETPNEALKVVWALNLHQLVGGFIIGKKFMEMLKRPTDDKRKKIISSLVAGLDQTAVWCGDYDLVASTERQLTRMSEVNFKFRAVCVNPNLDEEELRSAVKNQVKVLYGYAVNDPSKEIKAFAKKLVDAGITNLICPNIARILRDSPSLAGLQIATEISWLGETSNISYDADAALAAGVDILIIAPPGKEGVEEISEKALKIQDKLRVVS